MNRKISFKNNSLAKIFSSPKAKINAMVLRLSNLGCVNFMLAPIVTKNLKH